MEREPQSAYSRLKAAGVLELLKGRVAEANLYRFCQLLEQALPDHPPLGSTTSPADDPVRFRPDPGMGFPASELKAIETDDAQPAPEDSWVDVVKRDLGMFLDRLPGVEELYWSDGTAFADETTRAWITQHVSGNRPQQWLPATTAQPATTDTDILSLESEALAQADSDGIDAALAWLAARPEVDTGRQRWLLRLLMARVAEQYGKGELAIHLLGELESIAQRQALADWEPELNFEVKARLTATHGQLPRKALQSTLLDTVVQSNQVGLRVRNHP